MPQLACILLENCSGHPIPSHVKRLHVELLSKFGSGLFAFNSKVVDQLVVAASSEPRDASMSTTRTRRVTHRKPPGCVQGGV